MNFHFTLYFSAFALKSYYPLNLNWKVCLIERNVKLARNSTVLELGRCFVYHNGTHVFNGAVFNIADLDPSPTVMKQKFFDYKFLRILRRTYGGKHGSITVPKNQNFKVTASGSVDLDRVLMRVRAVDDNNRSKYTTMELHHTGEEICFSFLYF